MEIKPKSLRWVRTSRFSESDFRAFQKRMAESRYSDTAAVGFLTEQLTENVIKATLIERTLRESQIMGPMGEVQQLRWTEFRVFHINFDRKRSLIEVETASRSLRLLIQQLGFLSGWSASFEPLPLQIKAFLSILEGERIAFDVLQVEASNLVLSSNTSASIAAKGSGTVLKDLKGLLASRSSDLSRVALILGQRPQNALVELCDSGKIVISGENVDEALTICRKAIMKSLAVL